MSAALSAKELSQLRLDNEAHMNDRCNIIQRTDSVDSYGQPIATWSVQYSNVPCSFEFSPYKFRARETAVPGAESSEILVRARLPLKYYDDITKEKRLQLTRRFGRAETTTKYYEIQGEPEPQAFGITVNLQRVTP